MATSLLLSFLQQASNFKNSFACFGRDFAWLILLFHLPQLCTQCKDNCYVILHFCTTFVDTYAKCKLKVEVKKSGCMFCFSVSGQKRKYPEEEEKEEEEEEDDDDDSDKDGD